jgi:hypothetical protein
MSNRSQYEIEFENAKKADYVNIRHHLAKLKKQPAYRAADQAIQKQMEEDEKKRITTYRYVLLF